MEWGNNDHLKKGISPPKNVLNIENYLEKKKKSAKFRMSCHFLKSQRKNGHNEKQ